MGFGIGAASLVENVRFRNGGNLGIYMEKPLECREEIQRLSRQEQMPVCVLIRKLQKPLPVLLIKGRPLLQNQTVCADMLRRIIQAKQNTASEPAGADGGNNVSGAADGGRSGPAGI